MNDQGENNENNDSDENVDIAGCMQSFNVKIVRECLIVNQFYGTTPNLKMKV